MEARRKVYSVGINLLSSSTCCVGQETPISSTCGLWVTTSSDFSDSPVPSGSYPEIGAGESWLMDSGLVSSASGTLRRLRCRCSREYLEKSCFRLPLTFGVSSGESARFSIWLSGAMVTCQRRDGWTDWRLDGLTAEMVFRILPLVWIFSVHSNLILVIMWK